MSNFERWPSSPKEISEKAPKLEERGFLQRLSRIANKKFAMFAIALATSMAIELNCEYAF